MPKKTLIIKKVKTENEETTTKVIKAKKCPICNKEFITENKHQVYCSSKCRKEGTKEVKKIYHKSIKEKLKDYNKNYYETVTKVKRAKANKNKSNPTYTKVCPICKKEFTTESHRAKYCSPECKEIATKERMKNYIKSDKYKAYMQEYVKSGKYKEIRKNYYENKKLKMQEAQATIETLQKQVEKLTKELNKVKKGN